jgi:hypothetical protein
MPNFAIINGGTVVNVVVADNLETANELAVNAHIGQFAIQISSAPNAPTLGWKLHNGTLVESIPVESQS